MLEDFIEANKLQARILPYAAKGSLIKCELFSSDRGFALLIHFAKDVLDLGKAKAVLGGGNLEKAAKGEAEEVTGYSCEFMPPISIYGVKVLIDGKVFAAEEVRCLVGEEKTLAISPREIKEANEDSEVSDITR